VAIQMSGAQGVLELVVADAMPTLHKHHDALDGSACHSGGVTQCTRGNRCGMAPLS
jgi:hypothetical protein